MDAHRQRQPEVVARAAIAIAALLFVSSCSSSPKSSVKTTVGPTNVAVSYEALPFIHDDYPRALAEAKKTKKPIFVDSWAPWCHSCMSMKSYVLSDPALAPLAKDYVWLAIDTELESNAPFVAKFPHEALPTLWVIRPETEEVAWKWIGTLTVTELRDALTKDVKEGETPVRAAHDRVMELAKGNEAACAKLAIDEAKRLPKGTPRADVIVTGLECAAGAKLKAETTDLMTIAAEDALDARSPLLADDRSAIFEAMVDVKKAFGDESAAKAIAEQWARFLELEARKAKTPAARAVFDAHRLGAYLALEQPERAVPMLLESERDFPADYNPPARLAKAYLEMKKLDDAVAAAERARSRVYGPRVLRVLTLAADIAKARGDVTGERKALEEALARTEKPMLTPGQKKAREALAKRLAALPR